MPESGVTQGQFFLAVQQIHDQIDARHKSMRESMEGSFGRLDTKLDQHAKDDLAVERRVTIIETQRTEEAKQATKRGTWAGILAGIGVQIVMKVGEFMRGQG